jgi:hypothetical protein
MSCARMRVVRLPVRNMGASQRVKERQKVGERVVCRNGRCVEGQGGVVL